MSNDINVVLTYTRDEAEQVISALTTAIYSRDVALPDRDRMRLIRTAIRNATGSLGNTKIVIDPENVDQMLEVQRALLRVSPVRSISTLQDAFRKMLELPVEEPINPLAMVKDRHGNRWIKFRAGRVTPWHRYHFIGTADAEQKFWKDLDIPDDSYIVSMGVPKEEVFGG